MDRNSIIGVILIAVVIGAWTFYQSSVTRRDVHPTTTEQRRDTADSSRVAVPNAPPPPTTVEAADRTITVETDLLRVRLSSRGATVANWKLRHYKPWYHNQAGMDSAALVDLVQRGHREFGIRFRAANGGKVDATTLNYQWDVADDTVRLHGSATATVRGVAHLVGGGRIERIYRFTGDKYAVSTSLVLDSLENVLPRTNRFVTLGWKSGLRYQERSSVDESGSAVAMMSVAGDVSEFDASEYTDQEESLTGPIDYLAMRTKYFALAIKPSTSFDGRVTVGGQKYGAANDGFTERYRLEYRLPYSGGQQRYDMVLFGGPMQYDTLASYGLTGVMNFGFKWIVKPIGEYFMLPALRLVHSFIANWGIAIIVFSIFMKLLLTPLSLGQMRSAQKMQLVAPLMAEVREKYKDDMQTQQQETMKIYSQYGINPAGGCLPLLLQMPLLYALYAVLNYNIELRQAAFLPFWLTDLSMPDVVLDLGFKLPLVGIDKFSGLALLMGATLFIQQKQAVSDPRQKAMVYMMPVMFTLMFSSLPAGLNLYYFVFNVISIGMQVYMTKFSKNRLTLADLRAMPKKEGWLQRKMREAQEIAAAQGRTIPGQPPARQNRPGKDTKAKDAKSRPGKPRS